MDPAICSLVRPALFQILTQELNRKEDALTTYRQLLASVTPARKILEFGFVKATKPSRSFWVAKQ